jgi:SAM-dependent methyltransferase
MKHDQAALFDALATNDCLYRYEPDTLARINALLGDKGRTLDVGCGDGAIGAAIDGNPVFGFDISHRCAKLTAARGEAAVVASALGAFPFANAVFDTVFCVDVLHHLEQKWSMVFNELNRVLRPGGALVIVEPDARNPFVRWTQAPNSPIRVAPFNNEPAIEPPELLPILDALGFQSECTPINIDGEQVVRNIFPLWNRLLKAPFVMVMARLYANMPNKFAIVARKPA